MADLATERRVTELYAKAAELLGSDKAAARLAGLYPLERLAVVTLPGKPRGDRALVWRR